MPILAALDNYPLLNLFWTMLLLFVWIAWFFLLFRIITDIFRSEDVSGGMKAVWVVVILLLPFLGSLIYLIVRGEGMGRRERGAARANQEAVQHYIRDAAGSGRADELTKLADLRDKGVLTPEEFEAAKGKVLA